MDEVTIVSHRDKMMHLPPNLTKGGKEKDREPIYCEEIGLAIEKESTYHLDTQSLNCGMR